MRVALVASCTMACLAELRYATVITDEEGAAGFAIVLIPATFGYIALVDAAVVMQQNGGNVQSVGTRHAILAVVARGDRICLLYTSPSPRDRQKSRMPSSA